MIYFLLCIYLETGQNYEASYHNSYAALHKDATVAESDYTIKCSITKVDSMAYD